MRGPHNIIRLIRTGATFERTGAMNVVLDAFEAPKPLRILARTLGWPFKWLGYKGDPTMPPATRALTALGPAYIKFGQVLSTRPDVVGDDLAVQLRVLQDKLPPFSRAEAMAQVEQELGQPVDQIYSEFSEPIAAASIAQVHRARLRDTGQEVAVKVLRPGIERAFRKDVDAFYFAARIADLFAPGARRLKPMDVIKHFDGVVQGELDLRLESAAASEFAANTKNDEGFQLPQILWNHSARRVMTLGWADGLPLGDNAALDAAGHDRRVLAERVLSLFLRHALRDGYFHADMHQGNLKVAANGDIIAYDFGIMGHIDEYTRRVYAEILFGFIKRDYKRVAEVHFEAGYVPADRDVDEFARALRAVGEPIFGMDATHISMGRLLNYLFEVTERFGMETRTELILLQRTMVVVEGVARSLDPHINIWDSARPVVEDYIKKSIGPRAVVNDLMSTAKVMARFGPRLPALVEQALIAQIHETDDRNRRSGKTGWMLPGLCGLGLGLAIAFAAAAFS
ncbi:2-polyprenylphenol 6-hydroxylase [Phaeobacter gallaeciensis]|uniref:Ubiquinone biosynthesis protein UbiB n=1 Tax=Phaeobacter gallaeciensis TaxID=60890 RepID=A0AAC9ZCQ2_9RHOB|nr:2-polyprenylphenol 6-hydroxylase [Phaeobacter gallaeciensis]AHD11425.1 2-octaprenylphenol hydroxylase [Phaeobacter gallaeciensis DSM 26640]ATE94689.1 putative ubiquinone biosynthesis protein UbiB [Phaeobacter gallaeciensis]ATE98961.1 putative ubiquinone biosynthesis protein UbiB [Phaeobacter gallaeciensis]ATF03353.1 putative ubiquinone biosynthesis protein UbiB [Phaeobacter gallaeciensis]ATF07733.1 putative ubiquinone biosynthesis protein UbiB [Phaeobacter gallaeciensis]